MIDPLGNLQRRRRRRRHHLDSTDSNISKTIVIDTPDIWSRTAPEVKTAACLCRMAVSSTTTKARASSKATSFFTLFVVPLLLALFLLPATTIAWPYSDCSGPNSPFQLGQVQASYQTQNDSISLVIQGNLTTLIQAQGFLPAATSQWRAVVMASLLGNTIHKDTVDACSLFTNGTCPTAAGPVNISANLQVTQSAPFVELVVGVQINDQNNQTIACVAFLIEQPMPEANLAVSYIPLGLAIYSGFLSLFTTALRAAGGSSGFLGAAATYGLASGSLKVHTPGVFDIIFYTQFMVMSGQLSLNYPSFYQTFASLFHWSFLEFKNTLVGNGPANASEVLADLGAGSVNLYKSNPGPKAVTTTTSTAGKKRAWLEKYPLTFSSAVATTGAPKPTITSFKHHRDIAQSQPPSAATSVFRSGSPWSHGQGNMKRQASSGSDSTTPPPTTTTDPATTTTSTTSTDTTTTNPPTTQSSNGTTTATNTSTKKPTPTNPSATATAGNTTTSSTPAFTPTIYNPFTNDTYSENYNVSRFGIDSYAAAIGADPTNLFLGTFLNAMVFVLFSLFGSCILSVLAYIFAGTKYKRSRTVAHVWNFMAGNVVRVWVLVYTPLALMAMFQLSINGGAMLITLASLTILVLSVGASIFFTWRILRAATDMRLFENQATLLKYGSLYNTLSEEGTLFFLVGLLIRFLWGLSVAMLSSYGIAQVAVLVVVETGHIMVIGYRWPFSESSDNKFQLILGFARLLVAGCMVAYIHDLQVRPEVRQLFGYAQMAIHLGVHLVMFAFVLWNTLQAIVFWRFRNSAAWKASLSAYDFDQPIEADRSWVNLSAARAQRPMSTVVTGVNGGSDVNGGGSDTGGSAGDVSPKLMTAAAHIGGNGGGNGNGTLGKNAGNNSRRFTAQPYSVQETERLRAIGMSARPTPARGSEVMEDAYRSVPRRDYHVRRSLPAPDRRARLVAAAAAAAAAASSEEDMSMMGLERSPDALRPLSSAAGPMPTSTPGSSPYLNGGGSDLGNSDDGLNMMHHASSSLAARRFQQQQQQTPPQRSSYAMAERLSQQQALLDARSRTAARATRMNDSINANDLPSLRAEENGSKEPKVDLGASPRVVFIPDLERPSRLATAMEAIGSFFHLSFPGSNNKSRQGTSAGGANGQKPKAFEVIRTPRNFQHQHQPSSSSSSRGGNDSGSSTGRGMMMMRSALDDNGSILDGQGGKQDELRELNSLGISRFFQESDRGYERNRSLFVANPEGMLSKSGSTRSSIAGMIPPVRISRTGSETAGSIRSSIGGTNMSGTNPNARVLKPGHGSMELPSGSATLAEPHSQHQQQMSTSTQASNSPGESKRGSGLASSHSGLTNTANTPILSAAAAMVAASTAANGGQRISNNTHATTHATSSSAASISNYPRNSVESNIAEALMTDAPLRLQGGDILKVSKGPEKAVQYWHKESGQYVESVAEHQQSQQNQQQSILLLPSARSSVFSLALESARPSVVTTSQRGGGSIASRPESPTESLQSNQIGGLGASVIVTPAPPAVSLPGSPGSSSASVAGNSNAGRMHEILTRMFSDDDDDDEDESINEDSCSTFSGRVSHTILALQHKRQLEEAIVQGNVDPLMMMMLNKNANGGGGSTSSIMSNSTTPSRTPSVLGSVMESDGGEGYSSSNFLNLDSTGWSPQHVHSSVLTSSALLLPSRNTLSRSSSGPAVPTSSSYSTAQPTSPLLSTSPNLSSRPRALDKQLSLPSTATASTQQHNNASNPTNQSYNQQQQQHYSMSRPLAQQAQLPVHLQATTPIDWSTTLSSSSPVPAPATLAMIVPSLSSSPATKSPLMSSSQIGGNNTQKGPHANAAVSPSLLQQTLTNHVNGGDKQEVEENDDSDEELQMLPVS